MGLTLDIDDSRQLVWHTVLLNNSSRCVSPSTLFENPQIWVNQDTSFECFSSTSTLFDSNKIFDMIIEIGHEHVHW